ncbi:MAG: alpha/beta hydrolase [Bacteroidales bacterium]|nr:alpha/beta hydrolase [Bacteroidales bacterium]
MPAGPGEGSYSRSWKDVNYASDGMESHNMDIYLPKEQKNTYQAVIVIYGSAWFSNNAKAMASASIGTPLLNAGFAVISINHRSSTEAIWPAQIQDVKAAVRFVRANAARYDIDPSFIGITGFSSGGHLATFAGVTNGVKTLTAGDVTVDIEGTVGDYLSAGSHVDAVVDWFGPVDMARMSNCEAPNDASSPEAVLIGKKDPRHEPDWVKLISPINFVDEDDPKILIIHGDADNVVPHCQSLYLKTAYDRAGVEAIFISVPDGGHGPGCFDAQYFQKMTDFFTIQSSN